MNPRTKRRIRRVVITLIILYVTGGFILYLIQDLLLFHPTPLPLDHRFIFTQPFEEVNVPFEKNNLSIVKFKAGGHRKGLVLFFHGNMHNVEHYVKYTPLFTQNGYEVWMIDYPGFGKTTGTRSESILYQQAMTMYEMAAKEIQNDSILIYGKSIGTGIASYLASRTKCYRLILETPYYSIDALARHYFPIYPVIPMSRFSFPVHTYLHAIHFPVTIFHGTSDEVVPFVQSQRLAMENPAIELINIENGSHNNLFDYPLFQMKMDSLLK